MNEKKKAFCLKDKLKLSTAQKKTDEAIDLGKKNFKEQIERDFSKNSKQAWSGLKKIVGYKEKQTVIDHENGNKYVNDLNAFYSRFDQHDFSSQHNEARCELNMTSSDDPIVTVEEWEVTRIFRSLKTNKSCGPDNVSGRVLKACHYHLSELYCCIFNMSLVLHKIPISWKDSKIVPVPKKGKVNEMNDLRPVALTSILMKCLERLVFARLKPYVQPFQDSFQFAYQENRSVEDAIILFMDNIYEHLTYDRNYARVLFIDFSSAFNTIQPHLMIEKLINTGVNRHIISWILEFLTNRTQFVQMKIGETFYSSSSITTNTGAPQGCVLSPALFTLYTNDCQSQFSDVPILKFADDTSIQGLISKDNVYKYFQSIRFFVKWCEEHFLLLNVKKTKELIIDFRIKKDPHQPVRIHGENIEVVSSYKYLGIQIDDQLDWKPQNEQILSKIHKRMYFIRKLSYFGIDKTLINLFYKSTLQSIITFCIVAWGGNTRESDRDKIDSLIRKVNKITKVDNPFFQQLFESACITKFIKIEKDINYSIHRKIVRSKRPPHRLIFSNMKNERHRQSFLPYATRIMSLRDKR